MAEMAGPRVLWVRACPECGKCYLEAIIRLIPDDVCEACLLKRELELTDDMSAGRWVELTGRLNNWLAAQLVFKRLANKWRFYHLDRYVGQMLTSRPGVGM